MKDACCFLQTEKFKISVESLENTFVSATKSHE